MLRTGNDKHPTVWGTEPLGSGDESELTVLDQGSGGRCYGCKGVAGGGHGDCTLTGKAALGKQLSGRADLKFEQKKRTPFPFPWCCR